MLYIVGTPLGNLDDFSLRQAHLILTADVILTEDTRSTGMLRMRLGDMCGFEHNPEQKLISYYREREFEKLPQIIELIDAGKMVVLISEAGMPLVSDPGHLLVSQMIKRGVNYHVIPGPTALMTALIYSGFSKTGEFMFAGFLPKKESEYKKLIDGWQAHNKINPHMVFITYESPHRIEATLKMFDTLIPTAQICLCREMTKKFEEIVRGTPSELQGRDYKGEITLVTKL